MEGLTKTRRPCCSDRRGIARGSWCSVLNVVTAPASKDSDPLPMQQPHFDDLCKSHVAEQGEYKDGPVQPRKMRETQHRGQWGIAPNTPRGLAAQPTEGYIR